MVSRTLALQVAADSWNGDPQFTILVDGKQVGGSITASAQHAAGQWQNITVTGDLPADPSSIVVAFSNDAYGGWQQDRNLYLGSLTLDGQALAPAAVTGPGNSLSGGIATLLTNGTAAFNAGALTATVTPATGGAASATPAGAATAGANTLTFQVAADSWNGDPHFSVSVDGQQVGRTLTATASHAGGQWQDVTLTGNFSANPSNVDVTFSDDAYGGWGRDRNLYVKGLKLNGQALPVAGVTGSANSSSGDVATLLSNGTVAFGPAAGSTASASTPTTPQAPSPVAVAPTPVAPATSPQTASTGTDQLTLRVAGDDWNGDPQFTVSVDGKQVGGTLTTSASHAQGQWQDITLTGDFSTDPNVAITFTNDAYAGGNQDRNLFVKSVSLDGQSLLTGSDQSTPDGSVALLSNGTASYTAAASPPASTGTTPASSSGSSAGDGLPLLGVNLAGADFGPHTSSSTFGKDYTYPTHQEIDYYAAKGLNVIRVPFLWERMQPSLNGPLNQAELGRLTDVVDYASSKGLKTVLDPHDYGAYSGNLIGSAAVPDSSYADFWGKLASHFESNPNVIYGLMNEPNQQSAADWLTAANSAIAAIRGEGAHQEVLVPGTHWDGAWTWTSTDNASVIGTGVKDPDHNYAFEVHQYLDNDGSGTKAGVSSPTLGVDRLTSVTTWAENHDAKLFLGEFGVSNDSQSLSALDKMLTYMGQHSDVWQGGTYWAGGPWWWGSNIYGIEPDGLGTANVKDQPQMSVLQHHLPQS